MAVGCVASLGEMRRTWRGLWPCHVLAAAACFSDWQPWAVSPNPGVCLACVPAALVGEGLGRGPCGSCPQLCIICRHERMTLTRYIPRPWFRFAPAPLYLLQSLWLLWGLAPPPACSSFPELFALDRDLELLAAPSLAGWKASTTRLGVQAGPHCLHNPLAADLETGHMKLGMRSGHLAGQGGAVPAHWVLKARRWHCHCAC